MSYAFLLAVAFVLFCYSFSANPKRTLQGCGLFFLVLAILGIGFAGEIVPFFIGVVGSGLLLLLASLFI